MSDLGTCSSLSQGQVMVWGKPYHVSFLSTFDLLIWHIMTRNNRNTTRVGGGVGGRKRKENEKKMKRHGEPLLRSKIAFALSFACKRRPKLICLIT